LDTKELVVHGIPVSKGIAIGKVFIYHVITPSILESEIEDVETEIERFHGAVAKTKKDLLLLKKRIGEEMPLDLSHFLEAQLMMLDDAKFNSEVVEGIKRERKNCEHIYHKLITTFTGKLLVSKDAYFRERSYDIWDIANRLLRNLLGEEHVTILEAPKGSIVVTNDLPPSEAALINPKQILGVASEMGGVTSHTAIMAKALEIPAVLGVHDLLAKMIEGETIVLDGERGLVIKNPKESRIRNYEVEIERLEEHKRSLIPAAQLPPKTKDGKYIDISANIEFLSEVSSAIRYGAEGVGLFRTEFLYLAKRGLPTEEEQFQIYYSLAKRMKHKTVIIRTFDLGGDKVRAGYREANPFLGWRAIRVCLDDVGFFKTQLRAILRAAVLGNVKVMFPMIATIEELRKAKIILDRTKQDLTREKVEFGADLAVGIMVETPSAALMSEHLARECDFFSIGSNDLTQYTLAVDRGNERIHRLFDHFHPAVLKLVAMVADAAHKYNIMVGVCGEIASDILGLPLLVGLGVDELSMTPSVIPEAKYILRGIKVSDAVEIARQCLTLRTPLEVRRFLSRSIAKTFPDLLTAPSV